MALADEQIYAQNPWWTDAAWRGRDPILTRLETQPLRLAADIVGKLDLGAPGIHVLRGPRQVGKSTDLKLLVERALAEGIAPRAIVYLALDLLEDQPLTEVAASIERAKRLAGGDGNVGVGAGAGGGASAGGDAGGGAGAAGLLLLDEVTAVKRWQMVIKALWDSGVIDRDVVVCTGSSAIDLQRGAAERLPGRRGAGADHLVLPRSFATFARALDPNIPPSPGLTIAGLLAPDGVALLNEMRLHGGALEQALRRYLRFGGLPAAVAEAARGAHEPSPEVRRVLEDSLIGELQRGGASVPAARALLERVVRSLGAKISWSAMAREMDVPLGRAGARHASHHSVRDYVELLAAGYFLFVAYFWRSGSPTNALSRDKKVFLADPLLYTVALDRVPGLAADTPALVENAVAIALLRRYEPVERLIETFVLPERLHIWQTARGGEIDFVCGPRRALDVVEVKYRQHPGLSAAAAAARGHPGRPVVMATKDELRPGERYMLIPAHTLLWALG